MIYRDDLYDDPFDDGEPLDPFATPLRLPWDAGEFEFEPARPWWSRLWSWISGRFS